MQTIKTLLRLPDVEQRTGLKKSSLYALMADGLFPKVIKLTKHSSAWLESEIDGWITSRISERDNAPA